MERCSFTKGRAERTGEGHFGYSTLCVCLAWQIQYQRTLTEVCFQDGVQSASSSFFFQAGWDGKPLSGSVKVSDHHQPALLGCRCCSRSSLSQKSCWFDLDSSRVSCCAKASKLQNQLQSWEFSQFGCTGGRILGSVKCRPNPCSALPLELLRGAETSISPGAQSRAQVLMSRKKCSYCAPRRWTAETLKHESQLLF